LIKQGDFIFTDDGGLNKSKAIDIGYAVIERVCDFIGDQRSYPHAFLPEYMDENDPDGRDFDSSDRDPMFEDAARLIVQSQMGSTSLIQRITASLAE
jgi:S-DNA-T family DNA segregation ATPase FtsK/SpoIIIE